MAKNSLRRHHAKRLQMRWVSLSKGFGEIIPESSLGFGRIYRTDPLDCGNPKCQLCSREKVLTPKKTRNDLKKELRGILSENHFEL
jgi:hypothetical protein